MALGGTFTFPFHLGNAAPTDLNIAFSENGPFPPTNNLMQAEAGDKASSPTHVLGGLGNITRGTGPAVQDPA